MDKFSELISKGVAAFNYTPIADSLAGSCPICRAYNNVFGAATDTHMACLDDGRKVITGHIIADKCKFDRFIWSSQYLGVNFRHAGYYSFADWMNKQGLKGEYSILNGDTVYIVMDKDAGEEPAEVAVANVPVVIGASFTTESNSIPANVRFLSFEGDLNDINECAKDTVDDTAKALNESHYVRGKNWSPVYLSDGVHFMCSIKGENYLV